MSDGNAGPKGRRSSAARLALLRPDPPAYQLMTDTLRRRIREGHLPRGLLLQEGALAALFGSSRSPVKAALQQLLAEGLLCPSGGRGLLVGSRAVPANRTPLTHAMLGLDDTGPGLPRAQAWQKIYSTIERELLYRSVFGRFQVNELELARHYKVGRTVAHETLLRLQASGILSKGEKARWYIVPLDAQRLNELYELRQLIEPILVGNAARRIPAEILAPMQARLNAAIRRHPEVRIEELDHLEHDLHVTCLEYGGNREMFEALRRTRCILISGKHLLGNFLPYPRIDPFLAEHLEVIEALAARDAARARQAIRRHLLAAQEKVETRLKQFRARYTISPISFVSST